MLGREAEKPMIAVGRGAPGLERPESYVTGTRACTIKL